MKKKIINDTYIIEWIDTSSHTQDIIQPPVTPQNKPHVKTLKLKLKMP